MDAVGAPAKVGRVPAEEILVPIRQELRIIRGPPAARDGIPHEIDVDATFLKIREHLLVRQF